MKRRSICLILIFCLLLSLPGALCHADSNAADEPTYQPLAAVKSSRVPTGFGIDVSWYQGSIDWDLVATQIDFAILRCGYGSDYESQDDSTWYRNAAACTRLGIPFGVYLYSYAVTPEQARSEAQHVLRLLRGTRPTLPIYLDLEDPGTVAKLSNEEIYRNAKIFCDIIAEAGYTPGVYSSYFWWLHRLTDPGYDNWSRWLAFWNVDDPLYTGSYDFWQFGDSGTVNGISGSVDVNYRFDPAPPEELPDPGQSITLPPSCTEAGYTIHIPAAGEPYTGQYVGAYGHSYSDGICIRCGEAEPAACSGGSDCPSAAFLDAPPPDHWAHEGIDYCLKNNWMHGIGSESFSPQGIVTRAQLVTIVYRIAGSPAVSYSGQFSDVPGDLWYSQAVEWAAGEHIVNGVGDGRFAPDGAVTREQIVSILYRFIGVIEAAGDLSVFADGDCVSSYAKTAMRRAVSDSLIYGTTVNSALYLAPQQNATRAQIAAIIMRFCALYGSIL